MIYFLTNYPCTKPLDAYYSVKNLINAPVTLKYKFYLNTKKLTLSWLIKKYD